MEEVSLYLCAPVPQTRWKYHFIFHTLRWSFWGKNLCGHIISAGNIRILFCNVFFLFFSLPLPVKWKSFDVKRGKHTHCIMDLILMCTGEQQNVPMEQLSKQNHSRHNFFDSSTVTIKTWNWSSKLQNVLHFSSMAAKPKQTKHCYQLCYLFAPWDILWVHISESKWKKRTLHILPIALDYCHRSKQTWKSATISILYK